MFRNIQYALFKETEWISIKFCILLTSYIIGRKLPYGSFITTFCSCPKY